MKILANDGVSDKAIEILQKAGHEISTETIAQENLIDEINNKGINALLVRSATKVRKDIIDNCPDLKLIGRGGVGMDNIDVEYAREKGIEVVNTPKSSSQSVAELAMAHMFSMARFVYDSNRQMPKEDSDFKELKKAYGKGMELRGKKLGIIGFGRIGRSLAKYALGCGMKIHPNDSYLHEVVLYIDLEVEGIDTLNVPVHTETLETVLKESDIISLHVPMQEDGTAVIGEKEIAMMKDGVYLLNLARGGVIDEKALINALNSGKVAHAAIDVFENEPTPSRDLLNHSKVSLTPHIGAATNEAQARIGVELASKIVAFFEETVVS